MARKIKRESIPQDESIHKEGFLIKKTGLFQLWRPRYFVLLDDLLCYYTKRRYTKKLAPAGRIFINDIEKLERAEMKGHVHALQIVLKDRTHLISCKTYVEQKEWLEKIQQARDNQKNQEKEDPIRNKSTKLGKDYKRVTIKKDPTHGIGCTIKNIGGSIFVKRIMPDGPVATSGVLRPGDQIIDVNGTEITGCSMQEIKQIITESADHLICTVKPVTFYSANTPPLTRAGYTEVDPDVIRETCQSTEMISSASPYAELNIDVSVSELDIPSSGLSKDHVIDTGGLNFSTESLSAGKQPERTQSEPKRTTNYIELEFKK